MCSKVILKEKPIQQNALCKGQSITIGDGRQKPARQPRGLAHTLAKREGANGRQGDVEERGRGSGKTARGAGLYSLEKAAGAPEVPKTFLGLAPGNLPIGPGLVGVAVPLGGPGG